MFSSQSFVKAQIDSQLPASNTMPPKRPPTEMPPKMLELKLLCQGGNPGRAVTPEDIKMAPAELRYPAMAAMRSSLSKEQQKNYYRSQNERARHIWVAEYMLDHARVKCYGIQGSNYLLEEIAVAKKARRSELLEGIAVAKKRLSMVDAQLEMAKMRRTQICEEIGMKSNQVTLLDAQLDNAGIDCETEGNRKAIDCEKESIDCETEENMSAIECEKESIRRIFEAMLRRIEEP